MDEPICQVQRLGLVAYQKAWDLQNTLAEEIAADQRSETLLLLEHPHTYTLGRRGEADHLLWDEGQLAAMGVTVLWVDRGGDITYHGPGQLVGYPLLRLAPIGWEGTCIPQVDYVGYLRLLEAVLIRTLADFGLEGQQVPGKSGVWTRGDEAGMKKIASIGVKVDSHGVTRHGFALNVDPDARFWKGIVPCGLKGVEMTSMVVQLGAPVSMNQVMDALMEAFGGVFGRKMVCIESELDEIEG